MKAPSMRALPLVLALSLSAGVALAQTPGTSSAKTAPATGSSVTGGGSAPAAQPGTGTRNTETRKDDKVAHADRKFMEKAAEGGMMEVQAGQLASTKASDPEVKKFAETLVKDHSAANDELIKMANSKQVELPAAPTHGERKDIEKLGKQTGAAFDKQFVALGVKDHRKDVKEFEKASGKVKDPELKAWVDKTLPKLREHLAMAEKLQQSTGNSAAMGNRGATQSDIGTATPKGAATGTNTGNKTGS